MKVVSLFLVFAVVLFVVAACAKQQPPEVTEPQESQTVKDARTINEAIAAADTSACSSIADEQTKQVCIMNALYAKATNDGNPDMCDQITSEDIKATCKDNANLKLALNQDDQSVCSRIISTHVRAICLNQFT